jgi:hypothetical protein
LQSMLNCLPDPSFPELSGEISHLLAIRSEDFIELETGRRR